MSEAARPDRGSSRRAGSGGGTNAELTHSRTPPGSEETSSRGAPAPRGADETEAMIAFARVDFWCFVELMFPVLYPGQKLIYAPYLEPIATVLMSVADGRRRNVIVNLPPRHMKSALVSVLYPAWRLGELQPVLWTPR